ncbi:MAG: hypothetical protein ACREQZ_14195, partial [Woeseiaceae bacterium]
PLAIIDPSGFDGEDVTDTQPAPRNFPQCPYEIPGIAVDCPYRYGWRWDIDPFDLWLMQEYLVDLWVRSMMTAGGNGANRPPPPQRDPPPQPEYIPPDVPQGEPHDYSLCNPLVFPDHLEVEG